MNDQRLKKERLKNARLFRGFTVTQLAEKAGLTKQALSQYESGQNNPELDNLNKIAAALHFPIEYFSSANTYSIKTETTYFRSLLSTTKSDRLAQRVRLEFIAQIYETLYDYIDFPCLDLPKITFAEEDDSISDVHEIERIAKETRKHWRLGDGPITDLRYTLESKGIVVTSVDPKSEDISAFSQRTLINNSEMFFIVIANNGRTRDRARFDMAHELGHILLHPWSEDLEAVDKEEFKIREKQANMFASAFLLPKETFGRDIAVYNTNLDFYVRLKSKWHVSIKAMIYRAHQLGAITTNQYQYLMRVYSKNGWQKKEPGDETYSMKNNLLHDAIMLLLQEKEITPFVFLWALKKRGLDLFPDDIEELACLPKGILQKEEVKPKLILLKNT